MILRRISQFFSISGFFSLKKAFAFFFHLNCASKNMRSVPNCPWVEKMNRFFFKSTFWGLEQEIMILYILNCKDNTNIRRLALNLILLKSCWTVQWSGLEEIMVNYWSAKNVFVLLLKFCCNSKKGKFLMNRITRHRFDIKILMFNSFLF